ncbi:hemagglutinin repeat-containing protein [Labrenzia sp. R5_0]|uniref:two-partner secretion domain-containing protein n=1 Tax=Labrenzia sp. R5_0 TaxID=2821108 RepID=UPI001ADC6659|nr:hemagglutinin repeat-containing protein [Labrenzia sp. R5_0]MBO9458093.1 hemagglutinin repeat-containing protein [Labrenzia sp. R5_0]
MIKSVLNGFFCTVFLVQTSLPAFAGGLTPDGAAAPGNRPEIIAAPNGVPVQNIVTPNAQGLSHNKFTDFNVGKNGLILNNSKGVDQSNLGGYIVGNPNLQGSGPATVILNEVTSSNRSLLQGATELHGGQADYILANPNGITCNGCGFINIPRATLTTGVPQVDAGTLKGFSVDRGTVTIGADGVAAESVDYFDIVSRAVEINGKIHAGENLGVFAGRNDYDYANRSVAAKAGSAADKPEFAIDSSALGGMYAGRIKLIGTESGVGVRAPESATAATGDFQITADGKLVLGGTVSARKSLRARSVNGSVEVQQKASLYGQETLILKAGGDIKVAKEATLGAGSQVELEATGIDFDEAQLLAGMAPGGTLAAGVGSIKVATTGLAGFSAASHLQAGEAITFNVGALQQSGTVATDTYTVQASNDVVLGSASVSSAINVASSLGDVTVASGSVLYSGGDLALSAAGRLTVATAGEVNARDHVALTAPVIDISGGKVFAGVTGEGAAIPDVGTLTLTASGSLNVAAGSRIQSGDLTRITAGTWNQLGALEVGSLALDLGGLSLSGSGATVAARDISGSITGTATLAAAAPGLTATNALDLSVNDLTVAGLLRVNGTGQLTIGGTLSVTGKLEATGGLTVNGGTTSVAADAYIIANDAALFDGLDSFTNRGGVHAGNGLTIRSASLDNHGGVLVAENGLTLEGRTAGTKAASIINRKGGIIEARSGTLTIRAESLKNITGATFDTKTTAYANEVVAGAYPPDWLKGGFSKYWAAGGIGDWDQFWDTGGGPGGYVFVPHPEKIDEILTAKNATAADWDQNWWKDYAPTSISEFDPDNGTYDDWLMLAPDEDGAAGSGDVVTIYVTEDTYELVDPVARIAALNGNMVLDVGTLENEYSDIVASGDMRIDGTSIVNGGKTLTRVITIHQSWSSYETRTLGFAPSHKFLDNGVQSKTLSAETIDAVPATIHAGGSLIGNLTGTLTNEAGEPSTPEKLQKSTQDTSIVQLNASSQTPAFDPASYKFNGQLFSRAPESSPFLYETRFAFVDIGAFFGSQYFLDTVGIPDIDKHIRSLGDAYFESQYVAEQVRRATGRRWLSADQTSDALQMKTLIDNAGAQAEALDLAFGVSLSEEQIALLTSDIVWYERAVVDGVEVIAPRLYLASTTDLNKTGAVIAGRNTTLEAAEIRNVRGTIKADETLVASAAGTLLNRSGTISGRDVTLSGETVSIETATRATGNGTTAIGTWAYERGTVTAEDTLTIRSDSDTRITGADLASGGSLEIDAGRDLVVTAIELDSHFEASGQAGSNRYDVRESQTRVSGSTIQAADVADLKAGRNIAVEGSLIASDGTASLTAGENVTIGTAEESREDRSARNKSGFLTSSSRKRDSSSTTQVGSMVTALGDLEISAGAGDVVVKGSAVSSQSDVALSAGRDVRLEAAQNTSEDSRVDKKSGFFAETGNMGVVAGYKSERHTSDTSSLTQVTSAVSGRNVSIDAGRDVVSEAASVAADEDLGITAGRDIVLDSVHDLYAHSESHKIDTFALSVGAFENISGPVKSLADAPRMAASGKGNLGYQALSAVSAGLKAVDALNQLNAIRQGGTIAGVRIGIGISREESSSSEVSAIARTATLSAGNDMSLEAGRDITAKGARIDAGNDIAMAAGRDVILESAQNHLAYEGESSSMSAGIGLTLGVGASGKNGAPGASLSLGLDVSGQQSSYSQSQTYHTNTDVTAGGNVSVATGRDLALKGARIEADSADLDIGRNLTIESRLDTAEGSNQSSGYSAGVSVGIGLGADGAGPTFGASASVNGAKGSNSSAWVNAPSGIVTDNALNADVGETTSITGGVIASRSGDLTLETERLETADIDLHRKGWQVSGSVGVSIGSNPEGKSKPGITVEGAYSNSETEGVARATIGEGEITVRDGDGDGDGIKAADLEAEADAADAEGDTARAEALRAQADREAAEDTTATETQLSNLNRDPDAVVEVTSQKQEGFELYVSDTSIVKAVEAVETAGKTLADIADAVVDALSKDQDLPAEEAKTLKQAVKEAQADPEVREQLASCGQEQGWNLFDWIITPAHAQTMCSISLGSGETISLTPDQAEASLDIVDWIAGNLSAKGLARVLGPVGALLASTGPAGDVTEYSVTDTDGTRYDINIDGPEGTVTISFDGNDTATELKFTLSSNTGNYVLTSGEMNGQSLSQDALKKTWQVLANQIGDNGGPPLTDEDLGRTDENGSNNNNGGNGPHLVGPIGWESHSGGNDATKRTLTAAEQQKSHHIFGQDKHKMDPLVDRFGTQEQAYLELDAAAQQAYRNGDLNLNANGINTETRISVGGVEVDLVGGRVVDGKFVLGSASRRDIP